MTYYTWPRHLNATVELAIAAEVFCARCERPMRHVDAPRDPQPELFPAMPPETR